MSAVEFRELLQSRRILRLAIAGLLGQTGGRPRFPLNLEGKDSRVSLGIQKTSWNYGEDGFVVGKLLGEDFPGPLSHSISSIRLDISAGASIPSYRDRQKIHIEIHPKIGRKSSPKPF